ncbi:MAG: fibronectin type III domain-containing protein, partial [Thermoguttaceae bacterium]|nr:fibronectin type III domain-containing protein [Thermoguttaceae bacterium]
YNGNQATANNVLSGFTAWTSGANNYVYDASQPLFADAANGDYRLSSDSQALNKGNDAYAVDADGQKPTLDLAGNPRFSGKIDLGAYEYRQEEPLASPSLSASAESASSLNVKIGSVANASSYTLEYSTTSSFTLSTTIAKIYSNAGTYTLTDLAANTLYYVRVKAVGDGSSYLDSEWTSANATTLKVLLDNVALSGTAKVEQTLTASVSPSGATATYRWYRGTSATDVTTEISGATSATYQPTSADVGYYIKVVATGTGDYSGSVSATTASAVQSNAEPLASPSLTVSAASSSALSVKIGSVANASSYALEYSTTASFTSSTTITKEYASAGSHTLTGLTANTTYYVRVLAKGDGTSYADSAWSSVKSATTSKIALNKVTISGTTKVGETLTASVSPSGATATYQWYYGPSASSATTKISGATSAKFTITSDYVGKYLKVVATGTGDYRGSVLATVDLVPPAAPTNVKFGAYDAASKTATLTWTDNATNETRYEARFSVDGGATWTTLANLAANSTSRVCDDLDVGETYVFQIRAVAANGLASDWASAKFLVWATFGASEYVVEQNCAFYLSATGANDDSLSYYWDLSGSEVEESSNFIERESGFWTSVEELGFGVGEQTIRMRSRDASGTFGPIVTATLRVVASQPTFNVTTLSSADGSILRLNLRATTPDDSPIARWRLDWGDGQTSEFAELSDALTTGHYYASTAEDAVYEVSLTTFDATGAGGDFVYALTSHSVPGSVAASQASVETGASATILEGALTVDAASVCVAKEVEFVASFESASRGGRSTARSEAVSEAFAEFFAEDDGEDDFWFEFEKAAGKRR